MKNHSSVRLFMETFKGSDVDVRAGTLDCIFLLESATNNNAISFSERTRARSTLLFIKSQKVRPKTLLTGAWPRERFFLIAHLIDVSLYLLSQIHPRDHQTCCTPKVLFPRVMTNA